MPNLSGSWIFSPALRSILQKLRLIATQSVSTTVNIHYLIIKKSHCLANYKSTGTSHQEKLQNIQFLWE